MPFGLNKKEKDRDRDLDQQKSSLFSKKSSKSPAPPTANPYAAPAASSNPYAQRNANPYATQNTTNDPYAQQSQSSLSQPPRSSFGSLTLNSVQGDPPAYGSTASAPFRNEKSPVPPGGYGGSAPRFQGQGSYGQAGGYGSDPYGSGQSRVGSDPYGGGQSRYGASGYGGLGGMSRDTDTDSVDAGRSALFGDAPKRVQQQQQTAQQPQEAQDPSYSNSGGYSSAGMPGGYGNSEDRELTAEEQEEQGIDAMKNEIRFIKKQDVASTNNSLRILQQIDATGRETLERLGRQGESLHATEKNLDLSANHQRYAADQASQLKTLNRSMWAVHMKNPLKADQRARDADERALAERQDERKMEQATRAAGYSNQKMSAAQQRELNQNLAQTRREPRKIDPRYEFEADDEDVADEDQIQENLRLMTIGARNATLMGKALGETIDAHNKTIDRIADKTDSVDDQIALNRARLARIK